MSGWLTLADVADELGVSLRTVARWVQTGELPALTLPGGRKRIRKADYTAWLEQRMTPPALRRRVAAVDEEACDAGR